MASPQTSRIGWRWSLIALGLLAWASIGCSPSSLSMLLMPFADNKIAPEYKLFTKSDKLLGKEEPITLVILAGFAQPPVHPDHVAVEAELPEQLAQFFRKRCHENKHKLKLVPQAEVKAKKVELLAKGEFDPVEVGKLCKADYVLEVKIRSLSLHDKIYGEGNTFRGRAQISVGMHKMNVKDDDFEPSFHRELNYEYPREGVLAGTTDLAAFRRRFETKIARDVTKLFISFPPEEKNPFD